MRKTTSLENFLRETRSPGVIEAWYKPDGSYYVKRKISDGERFAREQYRRGDPSDLEAIVQLGKTKYVPLKEDLMKHKEEYLKNPDSEEELDEALREEDWDMMGNSVHKVETRPVPFQDEFGLEEALKNVTSTLYFDGALYLAGQGVFMKLDKNGQYHDLYGSARLEQNGDRALFDYFNDGKMGMKVSENKKNIILYHDGKDPFFENMEISYNPAKQTYRLKAETDYWLNHDVYGA